MGLEEATDETLFAAYRQGDMAAFDLLYGRYRQSLFLFLLRRGHPRSGAEDVFHDCWLKVIDQRSSFDNQNFRAWIFTIARNRSTDVFRRDSMHVVEAYDENADGTHPVSAQSVLEGLDCVELMKSAVAALPLEQRDAFLLRQEAGLSLQNLAGMMAVGRETVKSRLRYAMNQLKKVMVDCL